MISFPFESVNGYLSHNDKVALVGIAKRCGPINGDFVEIGSWEGLSTLVILSANAGGRLHAFDWFEPDKLARFTENLKRAGVDSKRVRIFPGDFRTSKRQFSQSVSFAFVDHDHAFDTTKAAYEWLWPLIVPGGVLAFHDFGHCDYPGGTEFIKSVGGFTAIPETGIAYFDKS